MSSCGYCNEPISEFAYNCDYCNGDFCQSHRLPENHDCTRISNARPPTSVAQEPDTFINESQGAESAHDLDLAELRERAETENMPYSVVEVDETLGNTPDPDFDSSPDVAVDGSVADESGPPEISTKERESISFNRTAFIIGFIITLAIAIGILFF